MTPRELEALLREGEQFCLLDVREHFEWELVRLEQARHIPLAQIPLRIAELNPAERTVVYCHHGIRSANAAAYLRQQGFTEVHNLEGGIDAWSRLIDPSKPRY